MFRFWRHACCRGFYVSLGWRLYILGHGPHVALCSTLGRPQGRRREERRNEEERTGGVGRVDVHTDCCTDTDVLCNVPFSMRTSRRDSLRHSVPGSRVRQSTNGNRISKLITAVYKVNRQDKTGSFPVAPPRLLVLAGGWWYPGPPGRVVAGVDCLLPHPSTTTTRVEAGKAI